MSSRAFLFVCLGLMLLRPVPAQAQAQEKSLYERLGGLYAVSALVDDFIDRLLSNELIIQNEHVKGALQPRPFNKVPGLKVHIVNLVCQLTGGTEHYSGRDMASSHAGLQIRPNEWDAMVGDFKAAMEAMKIPAREQAELLELVGSTRKDIVR